MELQITKAAQEVLEKKIQPDEQLILDIEDGDGPFAESMVTCQLDTAFRLLLVKKDTTADLQLYSEVVDTVLGPVRMKKSAEMYLDDPTILDLEPNYNSLRLKGKSGLLKNNLQVVRK
jgi:uncharacterized protein YqkB